MHRQEMVNTIIAKRQRVLLWYLLECASSCAQFKYEIIHCIYENSRFEIVFVEIVCKKRWWKISAIVTKISYTTVIGAFFPLQVCLRLPFLSEFKFSFNIASNVLLKIIACFSFRHYVLFYLDHSCSCFALSKIDLCTRLAMSYRC